jgi:hypothetical protein
MRPCHVRSSSLILRSPLHLSSFILATPDSNYRLLNNVLKGMVISYMQPSSWPSRSQLVDCSVEQHANQHHHRRCLRLTSGPQECWLATLNGQLWRVNNPTQDSTVAFHPFFLSSLPHNRASMLVVNANVPVNQCSGTVHVVTTMYGESPSPSLHDCQSGTSVSPASFSMDRVALLPHVIAIDILDMFGAHYILHSTYRESAVVCGGVRFSCF